MDISINGSIKTLDAAAEHLKQVNGVMMGRAVYENPYLLAEADRRFFGAQEAPPERHPLRADGKTAFVVSNDRPQCNDRGACAQNIERFSG
nr:tRNA-dihydrouridine synthase [Pyxidicoccus parkwaysis]